MSKIIILKKIIYETDQIYIEQDFGIEARLHDLIIVGRNDNDKMVTLESISEIFSYFIVFYNRVAKIPEKT